MSRKLTPDDWPGGRGAWVRFGLMLAVIWGLIAAAGTGFVCRRLLDLPTDMTVTAMVAAFLVGFVGFILVN